MSLSYKFLSSNQNLYNLLFILVSQVALVVKNLPANAGDIRDTGSIPGLGRSPGGGQGNPLQNSFLGNPMDRGAYIPLGSSGELQSIGSQRVGHD